MFTTIRHLLEMIRFSHTLFALPFALLAAVMAWTVNQQASPPVSWRWQELLGILLCMTTARSCAMAFNRVTDAKIDAKNPRTAGRHIPAKILSTKSVILFTILNGVGFIGSTLLFLPNKLPLYLAVPVLLFLCGYSFTKHFTSLAHFWLGLSLAMSPLAAWIAIRGSFVLTAPTDLFAPLVLSGVVMSWVSGFDIIYACQDFEFDRKSKLHSIPVKLGIQKSLWLAAACHLLTVGLLATLPLMYDNFNWPFWVGTFIVGGLLMYEHVLVQPDDLTRINIAFFNINTVISLGMLVVGCADLWWI